MSYLTNTQKSTPKVRALIVGICVMALNMVKNFAPAAGFETYSFSTGYRYFFSLPQEISDEPFRILTKSTFSTLLRRQEFRSLHDQYTFSLFNFVPH